MKYIKEINQFPHKKRRPSKGDYVLTEPRSEYWTTLHPEMAEFHHKNLKDRIGKLRNIDYTVSVTDPGPTFFVWYEGISDSWYQFKDTDIIEYSKTKEPLEKIIAQNRFDL